MNDHLNKNHLCLKAYEGTYNSSLWLNVQAHCLFILSGLSEPIGEPLFEVKRHKDNLLTALSIWQAHQPVPEVVHNPFYDITTSPDLHTLLQELKHLRGMKYHTRAFTRIHSHLTWTDTCAPTQPDSTMDMDRGLNTVRNRAPCVERGDGSTSRRVRYLVKFPSDLASKQLHCIPDRFDRLDTTLYTSGEGGLILPTSQPVIIMPTVDLSAKNRWNYGFLDEQLFQQLIHFSKPFDTTNLKPIGR